MTEDSETRAKRLAGYRAVDRYVKPDTCIGLGTGSTALFAIERVSELVAAGTALRVVATSLETERLCRERHVTTVGLGDEPIDVAIDGADEVAEDWALIKGGGGALFREKAIAIAAHTFVVIVAARKCVAKLGAFALPVEVVPFSLSYVAHELEALGAAVTLRRAAEGRAFVTDNGNGILDCAFGTIAAPAFLDRVIRDFHGVVTTGLFVDLTSAVLIGNDDGTVTELERPRPFSARA